MKILIPILIVLLVEGCAVKKSANTNEGKSSPTIISKKTAVENDGYKGRVKSVKVTAFKIEEKNGRQIKAQTSMIVTKYDKKGNKFEMLNENLLINSNLLKAVLATKVKKILFVGSTAVYNEKLKYNISEDKIFYRKPHSSEYYYSLSKRIMLEQLLALKSFYKIPYVYVIMNNLYGPRDNFDINTGHVVPSLIHKCFLAKKNNKKFEVWGNPNDRRCFLFSSDASERHGSGEQNNETDRQVLLRART